MKIDWVQAFIDQSNSTMIYWNIYIVIALGIIGFLIQSGAKINSEGKKYLLISWIIFALSNLIPLSFSQNTLIKIFKNLGEVQNVFSVTPLIYVVICHTIFDILISIIILRWKSK